MIEDKIVRTSTIASNGKFTQSEIELKFKKLEELKLGVLASEKCGNNKIVLKFIRVEKSEIEKNLPLFSSFTSFGLKLDDYYGKLLVLARGRADPTAVHCIGLD